MSRPTAEVLAAWARRLAEAGIEGAAFESELIYAFYAKLPRLEFDRLAAMPPELEARGEAAVARRLKREPLQYILGSAPFMNLELEVDPAVLIPRPETELLVEFLVKTLPAGGRLLDVGTGSGAIALAAVSERSDLAATALELSSAALAVARRNAAKYRLEDRVDFRRSDLLEALAPDESFDFIAANLPYVAADEYETLQPEVRDFEPVSALVADEDGLSLIRRLIPAAARHLPPGGILALEIGCRQGERVTRALAASRAYREIRVMKDYHDFDRFVIAERRGT